MKLIEEKCKDYADVRTELLGIAETIEAQKAAIEEKFAGPLKDCIKRYQRAEAKLHTAIDDNRAQFASPKTRVFHNVKVGLKKGPGRIVIEDKDVTLKLIKKVMGKDAGQYIQTEEKIIKDAIKKLDGKKLQKIGADFVASGNKIVISPVESDTEGLISAYLDAAKN